MKREHALGLVPFIKAWGEGKTIQVKRLGHWMDLSPDELDWKDDAENHRIKPSPLFRPWTLQEIPVGAVARRKDRELKVKSLGTPHHIAQVIYTADYTNEDKTTPGAVMREGWTGVSELLEMWEWRWPGETAWKHCGTAIE